MTVLRDIPIPVPPAPIAPATSLHDWFERTLQAAGVRAELPDSAFDPEAMADVLELARRSAESICRPASPLAAFAAGVALGRVGGDLADLKSIIRRIVMSMS